MNMMLVACGGTAIVVDVSVMFRAGAAGVDLISPDSAVAAVRSVLG
jgi:hypothetical protein